MSVADVYGEFEDVSVPASTLSTLVWAGLDIDLLTSQADLEADWRSLEATGVASAFQGFDYLRDWIRTSADCVGEEPLFAVGRRGRDVEFILPLAVFKFGGIKVLGWLGRAHASYGMGLFSPSFFERGNGHDFDTLVHKIAGHVGAHLAHLEHQPETWMGFKNPFAVSEASLLSANDTYIVSLGDDFEADYRRLFSSVGLSKMRRKWRRIQDFGSAEFSHPNAPEERVATLGWFIENKGRQLAEAGRSNPFGIEHIRDFYTALLQRDSFLIDELKLGERREAAGLTLVSGRAAYYLNTAFARSKISKYSPGSHLFHQLVKRLHRAGVRMVDLGPGDVPYKHEWHPDVINLRVATHLVRLRALPHYYFLRAGVKLKCFLKRNPALINLFRRIVALRGSKGTKPLSI